MRPSLNEVTGGLLRGFPDPAIPATAPQQRHDENRLVACQGRMRLLLERSGDPFHREHFKPGHFTASMFIFTHDGAQVLLVHHRKLERWLQPGGHFEASDASPPNAALRETEEETGLAMEAFLSPPSLLDLDIHRIPPNGREPAHQHFDIRFLVVVHPAVSVVEDPSVAWFPIAQVPVLDTDDSVRRALRRAQRNYRWS